MESCAGKREDQAPDGLNLAAKHGVSLFNDPALMKELAA